MTLYVYRCPDCHSSVSLAVQAVPTCGQCSTSMERMADTAQAILPIDPAAAALVPAKVEHLHKAGILLPETQHALDWLWRHKDTNGMASAFLKVGGRRCIDLVEFARLMRSKQA